ncbi:hypothetical protein TPHA_0L00990 [Tetrapisispora phaffii CBS 4417]|uniref:FHA domain-containing protein n=1 Tax=Tetrapisispora phaffii (strain ATCC 24235 / CBS 4417 / NBRC 1672 / NRRL Y-8282 / UCD 70-5) TaxID=1071381 RepID=G8BZX8_TETPH|nr:hypothetical protein TPHA_0L00990 [Tetrapisispora phaffii CBS 4417]CCE65456.1 hypothetical protein TPHA_0L00990 [Tetrapisispora phaffii CBS 4417]
MGKEKVDMGSRLRISTNVDIMSGGSHRLEADPHDSTAYEPLERLFQDQLPRKLPRRQKCVLILILKSLNSTFETKYLKLPFKPDGLRLGRPVAANNKNSSANILTTNKTDNGIDKETQQFPMVKPDTGYFDSRVLSRNHAVLSCDPKDGQIYIRDLNSSNGTFLNGKKIKSNEEYAVKVGDVIDLGTDIDNKTEHKKISAFVEDIAYIPILSIGGAMNRMINDDVDFTTNDNTNSMLSERNILTINTRIKPYSIQSDITTLAAYESNILGYNNPLILEDAILGVETEMLSGIYVNNSMGTSSDLMDVFKILATEISLNKSEALTCKSIEKYIQNFITNIEYLKKFNIEKNDNLLAKLQSNLKETLSKQHTDKMEAFQNLVDTLETDMDDLKNKMNIKKIEHEESILAIKNEIEDFKTRVEVENYKKSQLKKGKGQTNESSRSSYSRGDSSSSSLSNRNNDMVNDTNSKSDTNNESSETISRNNKVNEYKAYGKLPITSLKNILIAGSIAIAIIWSFIKS